MYRFRRLLAAFTITAFVLATLACSERSDAAPGDDDPAATPTAQSSDSAVLLFTIGMHIEPLGATAQFSDSPNASTGYNHVEAFQRGVDHILTVAAIVEDHGGRMTIQTQSPFTTTAVETGDTILSDLEDAGHEIGLHFHEDAHLGDAADTLPADRWCQVMQEEIDYIYQAGVEGEVSYWSGGNLYEHLLEAAECAGLSVNSDWKNPATQQTSPALIDSMPWRPAGSSVGDDTSAFALHDPEGAIIFVPEGDYDHTSFASSRRDLTDDEYFDYLAERLLAAVDSAEPGKVNVFHFTVHPGEFRGHSADPFAVIEQFLTDVVDPLVADGKVEWATLSEMAAAFESWEAGNPGVDPREGETVTVQPGPEPVPSPGPADAPPSQGRSPRPAPAFEGPADYDVTYCTADGVDLKMDVFYPGDSDTPAPALLYVHGGGWTSGSRSQGSGAEMIPEFVSRGFVVAAVDYRLAPAHPWPAQVEDVKCAVRHLRANAASYGIDPDRIGAYGGSAGGHLVALLGVTDGDEGLEGDGGYPGISSRVQAVVDMFGPADLTVPFDGANQRILSTVFGVDARPSDILATASPVTWASPDDPPFLILHGEDDSLVPLDQSLALHDALTAAGVDVTLVVVENAGHGFAPQGGTISPGRSDIILMAADFFEATLN